MSLHLILLSIFLQFSPAPTDIVGTWIAYDDKTAEATSHIYIYEENGAFHGRVVAMLRDDPSSLCEKCPGELKNKPVMQMVILNNLKFNEEYWTGGTILDPENGKTYKCNIYMDSTDELKLRGYIGAPLFGRSQRWIRADS